MRGFALICLLVCPLALCCAASAGARQSARTPLDETELRVITHELNDAIYFERRGLNSVNADQLELRLDDAMPSLEYVVHNLKGHELGGYDPTPKVQTALDKDRSAATASDKSLNYRLERVATAMKAKKAALADLEHIDAFGPVEGRGSSTETQPSTPASTPNGVVIIAGHELGWNFQTTPDICKGGTLQLTLTVNGIPASTKVELKLTGNGLPASVTLTVDPGVEVTRAFAVPGSKGPTTWVSQILSIGGKPPPTSGAHAAAFAQCPTT